METAFIIYLVVVAGIVAYIYLTDRQYGIDPDGNFWDISFDFLVVLCIALAWPIWAGIAIYSAGDDLWNKFKN